MLTSRLRTALAAALSIAVVCAIAPLIAQSPSLLVVATGLDNPRGLSFGPDGALYVTTSQIDKQPHPPGPYRLFKVVARE